MEVSGITSCVELSLSPSKAPTVGCSDNYGNGVQDEVQSMIFYAAVEATLPEVCDGTEYYRTCQNSQWGEWSETSNR